MTTVPTVDFVRRAPLRETGSAFADLTSEWGKARDQNREAHLRIRLIRDYANMIISDLKKKRRPAERLPRELLLILAKEVGRRPKIFATWWNRIHAAALASKDRRVIALARRIGEPAASAAVKNLLPGKVERELRAAHKLSVHIGLPIQSYPAVRKWLKRVDRQRWNYTIRKLRQAAQREWRK